MHRDPSDAHDVLTWFRTAAVLAAALPPTEAALGLARAIALGRRCLALTGPAGTA